LGEINVDIVEAVKARKTVRGFRSDPVPRKIIKEILEISSRAPSGMNTQPWEFTVVSGKALETISQENIKLLASGVEGRLTRYEGVYRERQIELAKQIFKLMDIPREDKEKRTEWLYRGFRYFDAPAAIILSMEKSLEGGLSLYDLGLISQTICLVALKYDLGTCIGIQGVTFPEVIRKYTGIPESKKIVISISIGYPDWNLTPNRLESTREDIETLTTWHGFND
jgi:nitroreductase